MGHAPCVVHRTATLCSARTCEYQLTHPRARHRHDDLLPAKRARTDSAPPPGTFVVIDDSSSSDDDTDPAPPPGTFIIVDDDDMDSWSLYASQDSVPETHLGRHDTVWFVVSSSDHLSEATACRTFGVAVSHILAASSKLSHTIYAIRESDPEATIRWTGSVGDVPPDAIRHDHYCNPLIHYVFGAYHIDHHYNLHIRKYSATLDDLTKYQNTTAYRLY